MSTIRADPLPRRIVRDLPNGRGRLELVRPMARTLDDAIADFIAAHEAAQIMQCAIVSWTDMIGGW
jgi:hypothetical protein